MALVTLVVLGFVGVLDGGNARRSAVAHYVDEVNATQRDFGVERGMVGTIYDAARTDPRGLAGRVADLDRSAVTLRTFDAHLRKIRPPADATELHRRLVAMSRAEAEFAEDVARLGRYLPVLAAERRALDAAGGRVQKDLRLAKEPAAQAAAFDRFAAAAAAAAKPLRATPVPTALEPVRAEEIARIAGLSDSARKLAVALREQRGEVQDILRRFTVAAAGNGTTVERAAVLAFNQQARRIERLRLDAGSERARLDRDLR